MLRPFRALRPKADRASQVAAVPYDVVSADEARALADGNPLSFLRVSRAEIEMAPGTDPYSDAVYQRAAGNFETLKKNAMVVDDDPSIHAGLLRLIKAMGCEAITAATDVYLGDTLGETGLFGGLCGRGERVRDPLRITRSREVPIVKTQVHWSPSLVITPRIALQQSE